MDRHDHESAIETEDGHRLTPWRRFGSPNFKFKNGGLLGWDPSGSVLHLRPTPDASDPAVESWDVRTGERLTRTCLARRAPVAGLAIDAACSPITRWTDEERCSVTLWDLRAGKVLAAFPGVWRDDLFATSADGRLAIHYHDSLDVHALPGGALVGSWPRHRRPFAASPDGSLVVALAPSGELTVARPDGTPVAALRWSAPGWPTAVAFSRDGRRLFAGGTQARVACWDLATGDLLWHASSPTDHSDDVAAVACSADGATLFAVEHGYRLCAFSAAGEVRWRASVSNYFGESTGGIQLLASPDGRRLAVSVHGALPRVVDAATGADRTPVEGHRGRLVALALSSDGRLAASGDGEGEVRVYDLARGEVLWTLEVVERGAGVSSLTFSRDGRSLWAGASGWVQRWSLATGFEESRRRRSFRQEGPGIVGAHDDARMLVIDWRVELWSDRSATTVQWAWAGGRAPCEAAFSDAEARVVVADSQVPGAEGASWSLVTLDAETGREVARERVPGRLVGLCATDDGPLSIGRVDEWLVVREAYGARREVAVREASDAVRVVAASADGRWMALADGDDVELWSLGPAARCVARVRPAGELDEVAQLALSHDGGLLVVGTACGVVAVYARGQP